MHRRFGALLAVVVLLTTILVGPGVQSSAQDNRREARDDAQAPGEGISELVAVRYTTDDVPATVEALTFERLAIGPGAHSDWRELSAPELLLTEAGTILITDQFGFEGRLAEGQSLLLRAGASYAIKGGDAPATLLRVRLAEAVETPASTPELVPPAIEEAPVASPQASPIASPIAATPEVAAVVELETTPVAASIETEILLQSSAFELPSSSIELSLTLLEFAPGADTGDYTHSAPLGLYVTSGTLDVTSPSGLSAQLPAGRGVLLPAGSIHREQNLGLTPAIAWVVGVTPSGSPLVAQILPTPTPTPEPTATPAPTSTPIPSPTPTPSPTPEPTPTPTPIAAGTVLYDSSVEGFEAWNPRSPWIAHQGMLVSDGTMGSWITIPIDISVRDYAIEAEAQILQESWIDAFRLGLRGHIVWGYFNRADEVGVYIENGGQDIRQFGVDLGREWHVLRVEVSGNTATVLIDGTVVLTFQDNLLLSQPTGPAEVFAGEGWQVNIRRVTVVALGD